MDKKMLQKLADLGELEDLGNGRKGVRVSLQYQHRFGETSRELRRHELATQFERVARELAPAGVIVDCGSISTSAQTVEAVLPLDSIDALEQKLAQQMFRIDALIPRRIVE